MEASLNEVLTSVLPLRPLSFDRLMPFRGHPNSIPVPWRTLFPRRTGTISRPSSRPGSG